MQRKKFLALTAAAIPAVLLTNQSFGENQRTPKGFVIKSGRSRYDETTLLFGGTSPNDIKISAKDTDGQLSVFEYVGHVKGGPPLHVHAKQDEIFFIVEGDYRFKVGEEMYELGAGDMIFLPRKVPHTFSQLSETGRMLFMFQPSGKMEDFFRKLSTFKGEPSPQEGMKLFADHEMTVVGAPI